MVDVLFSWAPYCSLRHPLVVTEKSWSYAIRDCLVSLLVCFQRLREWRKAVFIFGTLRLKCWRWAAFVFQNLTNSRQLKPTAWNIKLFYRKWRRDVYKTSRHSSASFFFIKYWCCIFALLYCCKECFQIPSLSSVSEWFSSSIQIAMEANWSTFLEVQLCTRFIELSGEHFTSSCYCIVSPWLEQKFLLLESSTNG